MNLGFNPTVANPAPTAEQAAQIRKVIGAGSSEPTYYFTDASSPGDWTELGNWFLDHEETIPAMTLPPESARVIVKNEITNIGGSVRVNSLTFLYGAALHDVVGGVITSETPVVFMGLSGILAGTLVGDAIFYADDCFVDTDGTISGTAWFMGANISFFGTVTWNAYFRDLADNQGTVLGTAGTIGDYFGGVSDAVRYVEQSLSSGQKQQALANIDVPALTFAGPNPNGNAYAVIDLAPTGLAGNFIEVDELTLNGNLYVFTASPVAPTDVQLGADFDESVINLLAAVATNETDIQLSYYGSGNLYCIATTPGSGGNTIEVGASLDAGGAFYYPDFGGSPVTFLNGGGAALAASYLGQFASCATAFWQYLGGVWHPRFTLDGDPIAYNATLSAYRKLTVSGADGSEIITISAL